MLRNSWPLSFMGRRSAGGDPYWSSVKLLMGFEGSDGSTIMPDESSAAHGNATIQGNAQIDTAQFKFGSSSLLIDPTDDGINFADSEDWNLGSGQFTIEGWFRFNNVASGVHDLIAIWPSSQQSWILVWSRTAGRLSFFYSTTGSNSTEIFASWFASASTWHHIAVDRDGSNTLRIYVDGAMFASAAAAVTFHNSTGSLWIGARSSTTFELDGWIDEIRITKGVARYASDSGYTVPTEAFPRS